MTVNAGNVISVILAAVAYSANGGPIGHAYIDPYFSLSPDAIAAGYSLVFSADIGNIQPVPEPPTIATLASGLALLALVSARARRKHENPRMSGH